MKCMIPDRKKENKEVKQDKGPIDSFEGMNEVIPLKYAFVEEENKKQIYYLLSELDREINQVAAENIRQYLLNFLEEIEEQERQKEFLEQQEYEDYYNELEDAWVDS